jgi:hypothetical protein
MSDLDRLIDDVAREMTEAPASVGMCERILAAVVMDEAKASYHPFARWAWLAAAAAVVIGAYFQVGSLVDPQRRTPPSSTQTSDTEPRAVPDKMARSQRSAVAAVRSAPAPRRIRPPRGRSVASTVAALPALTGPNALAIAPLDSAAHFVSALDDIAPLGVERLDIKPLDLPD